MPQCENCGANLRPDARRCVKCGSTVPEPAVPPPAESPQAAPPPPRPTPVGPPPKDVNVNVTLQHPGAYSGPYQQGQAHQPAYGQPQQPYGYPQQQAVPLKPTRGGAIIILGILNWTCLPLLVLGLIGWSMANADLRDIRNGVKDPSGRGAVVVGKWICIIGVLGEAILYTLLLLAALLPE